MQQSALELEDLCSGTAFSLQTSRAGCVYVLLYLSGPVSSLNADKDPNLNSLPYFISLVWGPL